VTNYNSSDLYAIDEKTSRKVGPPLSLPVNPHALAVGGATVWVASQPDNTLTEVITSPGG
jgi:hypothetical protein